MGLQVAAEKSEAVRFRRRGEKKMKGNFTIMIENSRIPLKYNMKYLGILVRDDWSIRDHFEKIIIKAELTSNKLMRLMLNKKGPSEKKRKLYQNVANSVILYGAPVWAEEVGDFPNMAKKVRAV